MSLEEKLYGAIPEVETCVLAADRNRDGLVAVAVVSDYFVKSFEGAHAVPHYTTLHYTTIHYMVLMSG